MTAAQDAAAVGRELEEFAAAVDDMPPVLERIAVRGADIMRPLMPVRTGALRRTGRGDVINGAAVVLAGGPTVDYAGAANARAHFIEQTAALLEPDAVRAYASGIDTEINKRGLNR